MNTLAGLTNPSRVPTIQRHLAPGLHKMTVDADARDFDWESLYVTLNQFGNVNQRTGPWDFMLDGTARPLVPAYWVHLNGRKIGLWYFNRPSVEQVQSRRMKGEAQFWIEREGECEIRFEPYRTFTVEWANVQFELSPDDTLLDKPTVRPEANRGFHRLFDASRWDNLRRNLDDPAFPYAAMVREGIAATLNQKDGGGLPWLAASYRLRHDAATLEQARQIIATILALPAWGNPREDGYSHNGDMGAARCILNLALVVNLLGDELGAPLVESILARLHKQGDIFIELALLQHGYWGGSILQDHGFKSFGTFSAAAYALVGWLPRAEHWLRFCLPRMQRTLRAMPTDGVVPSTSYHTPASYVDKLVLFRELHRQATGQDIYDQPAVRNVVDYCVESYAAETGQFLHAAPRGDLTNHVGGQAFFDQIARTFHDADAGWLSRESFRVIEKKHPGGKGFPVDEAALWGALLYETVEFRRHPSPYPLPQGEREYRDHAAIGTEPSPLPSGGENQGEGDSDRALQSVQFQAKPRPPRRLRWFQDSGAILFRDDARGILFSTRLGNSNSRTSWENSASPCDRISFAPLAGNFATTRHGQPLIQTAEGGYSMRTDLGNVLLVDGKGQKDDMAFAMGYPDVPWMEERIEEATLDPQTGAGHVRMQLAPVYDGLTSYTREWFFESDGRMRLVDTITASQPRRFTWLFHTYRVHPITRQGAGWFVIQNGTARLEIQAARSTAPLADAIADTLTVWAYSNQQGGNGCHHLSFETREKVREIEVEFLLR